MNSEPNTMGFPPNKEFGEGDFVRGVLNYPGQKTLRWDDDLFNHGNVNDLSSSDEDDEEENEVKRADDNDFSHSPIFNSDSSSMRSFVSVLDKDRQAKDNHEDGNGPADASSFNDDRSSMRSFTSVDNRRQVQAPSPSIESSITRYTVALERQPTASVIDSSSPGSNSTPEPKHFDVYKPYRSFLARDVNFTGPTALETAFLRHSRIAHRIQSDEEINFHRYLDWLESEQRRAHADVPGSDSDAGFVNEDGFMMSTPQQRKKKHPLPPLPELTASTSTLRTTESEPFNSSLRLTRCNAREQTVEREDSSSTQEHSSPGIAWSSPHGVRGGTGAWWVAVPAASESGEVWENIDEPWIQRSRRQEEDLSSFTAYDEDLIDESELLSGAQAGKKRKSRWGRCNKVLKRAFGRKE